jgi:hypothetical protein
MQQKLLRDLIETQVHLGQESSTGFRAVRCASCNDHSERAGFKFDGETVGYSCFNCAAKFRYEEGSGKLGRSAKRILEAFGISQNQLNEVTGSSFFNKSQEPKEITLESMAPKVRLFTPEVALPPKSHPLGSPFADELQAPIIEYLMKRKIDPLEVQAHFSLDPKFLYRVIMPCMREGKVIYWQARTILDGVKPRYMSPGINKDAVLWGYDNLWRDHDQPLFCTEGIFDAAALNGVALLGSKLNESKLEVLNRCRRRKIVVVDRDDNGGELAQLALENKWEITFPPAGVDDVNKSVQKYGRLLTIWTLLKNATVPQGLKAADGLAVQSKLALGMELALAKLSRRK